MSSGAEMYRLGPFVLQSEIPIPELMPLHPPQTAVAHSPAPPPTVSIRLAPVPARIPNVVAHETRWFASREEYLLRVPNVAGFLVRRGREVLVEPAPNALPADIRAYLLSPIFSTLCHQVGMYSLHASSVRVGDGVVAFLGHSGAGKSTLAAFLHRRGYPVVSDDICLLDSRSPGTDPSAATSADDWKPAPTFVVPVAPALKLWRSALDALGASPELLPRVFSADDKYRLKLPPQENCHPDPERSEGEGPASAVVPTPLDHPLPLPLPLRRLYFLEWAEPNEEDKPTFTPIDAVHAITRLMEFTHYDYLMKATGRQTGNFLLCGRILAHARAFTLRRPRNFARLNPTLDALEAHLTNTAP
jgi:hypothetical protein